MNIRFWDCGLPIGIFYWVSVVFVLIADDAIFYKLLKFFV